MLDDGHEQEARDCSNRGLEVSTSPPPCNCTLTYGEYRGIGLAVTKLLLDDFGAIVVALARTQTREISSLLEAHSSTLLFIKADVYVFPRLCLLMLHLIYVCIK